MAGHTLRCCQAFVCVCVKMQLFRDTVCLYKPSQADDHDSRSAQACSFVQEMRL